MGQLAWNELFNSFGNGTSLLTADQILAQVSLEWFTNTSATAGRYHYEEAHLESGSRVNRRPLGVSVFADDFKSIRKFADRDNSSIVYWGNQPKGGHYASMEVPGAVVEEIRRFRVALSTH